MWVIYRKSDLKIIGLSPNCEMDPDRESAIRETVAGSRNPGEPDEYDAIQVTDREMASQYMRAFPERLAVSGTAKKPKLSIRDRETASLYITTDAAYLHPVDGIPGIPADGSSSVLLTIRKMDIRARPLEGTGDNDQLYFRTDHGIVRDSDGSGDIQGIRLDHGKACIRLFSEAVKRVATLQIMSDNPDLKGSLIRIEFI